MKKKQGDFPLMKKRRIKKFICVYILCIFTICLSYYFSLSQKAIGTSNPLGQHQVGNANYFNPVNGEYYQDKKYRIKANDNTIYLLNLFNSTDKIYVPKGNFLCKKQIKIKGKRVTISGINGKTKIIFSGNSFKNTSYESAIINENNLQYYKKDTAQKINIFGITFEYKRMNLISPKTIFILSNVNRVSIKDCNFIADFNNSIPVTLLDLYNCCKNVELNKVSFINMTGADSGGSIWIRNLTKEYNNPINITQGIIVKNCNFKQNTNDEIIAIFSCRGDIKNVKIMNCLFKEESVQNVMALSIYPSENKYTGTIDRVLFDNNTFISKYLNLFLITIGGEGRKNKVSDIIISNNSIDIKGESNSNTNKFVIYASNKGTDIEGIKIIKNVIRMGKLTNTSVVSNTNKVNNNRIIGKAKNGIIGGYVYNNVIDGVENAIISPNIAVANKLINTVVGVTCNKENSSIKENVISLNKEVGICGIKVQTAQLKHSSSIICKNNRVTTFKKNQSGLIIYGYKEIKLGLNSIVGPGKETIQSK